MADKTEPQDLFPENPTIEQTLKGFQHSQQRLLCGMDDNVRAINELAKRLATLERDSSVPCPELKDLAAELGFPGPRSLAVFLRGAKEVLRKRK